MHHGYSRYTTSKNNGRREHDGLEEVERPEGSGAGLLGEQEARAAARVPDGEGSRQPEAVNGGQDVASEGAPVEVHSRGHGRVTVAPLVEREAMEQPSQRPRERRKDHAVETGGVGEQQRRTVPAEIVDGDADAVGGRHGSRGHGRRP